MPLRRRRQGAARWGGGEGRQQHRGAAQAQLDSLCVLSYVITTDSTCMPSCSCTSSLVVLPSADFLQSVTCAAGAPRTQGGRCGWHCTWKPPPHVTDCPAAGCGALLAHRGRKLREVAVEEFHRGLGQVGDVRPLRLRMPDEMAAGVSRGSARLVRGLTSCVHAGTPRRNQDPPPQAHNVLRLDVGLLKRCS